MKVAGQHPGAWPVRYRAPRQAGDGKPPGTHFDCPSCAHDMRKREPAIVIRCGGRVDGIAAQADRCFCNHGTACIADDPVHLCCLRGEIRKGQRYEKQGQDESRSGVRHRGKSLFRSVGALHHRSIARPSPRRPRLLGPLPDWMNLVRTPIPTAGHRIHAVERLNR